MQYFEYNINFQLSYGIQCVKQQQDNETDRLASLFLAFNKEKTISLETNKSVILNIICAIFMLMFHILLQF